MRFGQVDAALHSFGIIETAGMDIGYLGYREPIESIGQIVKINRFFMQLIIIFAFEHGVQEAGKRHGCNKNGYLADELAPCRKKRALLFTFWFHKMVYDPIKEPPDIPQEQHHDEKYFGKEKGEE